MGYARVTMAEINEVKSVDIIRADGHVITLTCADEETARKILELVTGGDVTAAYCDAINETAAKITPMRRVISCAPSHAWITAYDQTFTSMQQVITELHRCGYETAADYGTTKHTMVYKNGAIVAEIA